jgi:GYF domain 2
MAEIKISCPQCGQHIQCDKSYGGRQINCPQCQTAFAVPQLAPPKPVFNIAAKREKLYLVNSGDKQCGPYTAEELKTYLESGELSWGDLAWCEGMSQWQPLNGIIVPTGLSSTPPPLPQASKRHGQKGGKKFKAIWWVVSSHVLTSLVFFPLGILIILSFIYLITTFYFDVNLIQMMNPLLLKVVTLLVGLGVVLYSTSYSLAYLEAKVDTSEWSKCTVPSIIVAILLYLGSFFGALALVPSLREEGTIAVFTGNTLLAILCAANHF